MRRMARLMNAVSIAGVLWRVMMGSLDPNAWLDLVNKVTFVPALIIAVIVLWSAYRGCIGMKVQIKALQAEIDRLVALNK
jgi:hypothetical protein